MLKSTLDIIARQILASSTIYIDNLPEVAQADETVAAVLLRQAEIWLRTRYGVDVLVVDDQPTPGGQIWRKVEAVACTPRAVIFGSAYAEGLNTVGRFRASGAGYEPDTQVWHIEPGPRAVMTRAGAASSVEARCMLLATAAQERPAPFPGWTLPGVMTVGAAKIMLKMSGQVPTDPVWIAGNGPLALLYAAQLLKAGGEVAGYLDTTPAVRAATTLPDLAAAIKRRH